VWENLALLKPTDQIELVLASKTDFDWVVGTIREHSLDRRFLVLLSAVFAMVSPRELAEWLLHSRLNVRLQLQLRKLIWEPNARGV
jgi:7-carboxy-7-deazaguanine synthase